MQPILKLVFLLNIYHDITEILLKVALYTINQPKTSSFWIKNL